MKKTIKSFLKAVFQLLYFYAPNYANSLLRLLSKFHRAFKFEYLMLNKTHPIFKNEVKEKLENKEFYQIASNLKITSDLARVLNEDERLMQLFYENALHDLTNYKESVFLNYLKIASKLSNPEILKTLHKTIFILKIQTLEEASDKFVILNQENKDYKFSYPKLTDNSERKDNLKLINNTEYVAHLSDVIVTPGLAVEKNGKYIISDPSAHPEHEEISGLYNYFSGGKDSEYVVATYNPTISQEIENGILIAGRNSSNLFHWLIEYLPRLKTVLQSEVPTTYEIIIPDSIPTQLKEALTFVNDSKYKIREINSLECTFVKNLIVPSFHTFIPDRYDMPFWKTSLLSSSHLDFIRDKILKKDHSSSKDFPKIYLSRRKMKARQIKNKSTVEKVFISFGYTILYPEDYTFLEQIALIRQATHIAGPGGAALSNLLFCKPATIITVLIAEQNKEFCLHSNLANYAKADFYYHISKIRAPRESFSSIQEFFHAPFKVDIRKLKKFLNKIH